MFDSEGWCILKRAFIKWSAPYVTLQTSLFKLLDCICHGEKAGSTDKLADQAQAVEATDEKQMRRYNR